MKPLKDWRKDDIVLWKLKLFDALSGKHEAASPLDVVYEHFDLLGAPNRDKVPDYIYCSAIHLLLSRKCVQEALSLLVQVSNIDQAHLNSIVLDIGTYEYIMRIIKEAKLDKSYLVVCFNMLVEHFSPNSRMYEILHAEKKYSRQSRSTFALQAMAISTHYWI